MCPFCGDLYQYFFTQNLLPSVHILFVVVVLYLHCIIITEKYVYNTAIFITNICLSAEIYINICFDVVFR